MTQYYYKHTLFINSGTVFLLTHFVKFVHLRFLLYIYLPEIFIQYAIFHILLTSWCFNTHQSSIMQSIEIFVFYVVYHTWSIPRNKYAFSRDSMSSVSRMRKMFNLVFLKTDFDYLMFPSFKIFGRTSLLWCVHLKCYP